MTTIIELLSDSRLGLLIKAIASSTVASGEIVNTLGAIAVLGSMVVSVGL
ncbi:MULTISPECIES: hypothetical protein [Oscillatoriales]|nr:hypothetical protein [Arthrospira platensis]MDT9184539.1 hypothetical protein [Limnospira sp. PMC 289.06]MDT9296718.1 hypothetical protein [Arthrospira platensis PCC 7345]MDT9312284.1 hypothetical protein [Limnospira sp. Paracas R14]